MQHRRGVTGELFGLACLWSKRRQRLGGGSGGQQQVWTYASVLAQQGGADIVPLMCVLRFAEWLLEALAAAEGWQC